MCVCDGVLASVSQVILFENVAPDDAEEFPDLSWLRAPVMLAGVLLFLLFKFLRPKGPTTTTPKGAPSFAKGKSASQSTQAAPKT